MARASSFIGGTEQGDSVTFWYRNSYSGKTTEISAHVTENERGLWVQLESADGTDWKIFGNEVSDREEGAVFKDDRKNGEFLGYEVQE